MSDRLADLTELRGRLLDAMDAVEPDKLAPLAARFSEVVEQIAELTPSKKAGDPIDEVAARRAARKSGAASR